VVDGLSRPTGPALRNVRVIPDAHDPEGDGFLLPFSVGTPPPQIFSSLLGRPSLFRKTSLYVTTFPPVFFLDSGFPYLFGLDVICFPRQFLLSASSFAADFTSVMNFQGPSFSFFLQLNPKTKVLCQQFFSVLRTGSPRPLGSQMAATIHPKVRELQNSTLPLLLLPRTGDRWVFIREGQCPFSFPWVPFNTLRLSRARGLRQTLFPNVSPPPGGPRSPFVGRPLPPLELLNPFMLLRAELFPLELSAFFFFFFLSVPLIRNVSRLDGCSVSSGLLARGR